MLVVIGHGGYTPENFTYVLPESPQLHLYAPPGEHLAGAAALKVLDSFSRGEPGRGIVVFPGPSVDAGVQAGAGVPKHLQVPNIEITALTDAEWERVVDVLENPGSCAEWLYVPGTAEKLCTGGCAYPAPHTCGGLLGTRATRAPLHLVVCSSVEAEQGAPTSWKVSGADSGWEDGLVREAQKLEKAFADDYGSAVRLLAALEGEDPLKAAQLREFEPIKCYEEQSWCALSAQTPMDCVIALNDLGGAALDARDSIDRRIVSQVCGQYIMEFDSPAHFAEFFMAAKFESTRMYAIFLAELGIDQDILAGLEEWGFKAD